MDPLSDAPLPSSPVVSRRRHLPGLLAPEAWSDADPPSWAPDPDEEDAGFDYVDEGAQEMQPEAGAEPDDGVEDEDDKGDPETVAYDEAPVPRDILNRPLGPLDALAFVAASDPLEPASFASSPPRREPSFKTPINYKSGVRPVPGSARHEDTGLLEAAIAASSPVKALLQLATPRYSGGSHRHMFPPPSAPSSSLDLPSPTALPPAPPRPGATSVLTAVASSPTGNQAQGARDPRPTYVSLIGSAILSHPQRRAPLSYILSWLGQTLPERFGGERSGNWWGNSVRHNLSIQDCFIKVSPTGAPLNDSMMSPNGMMSPGSEDVLSPNQPKSKGNLWTIREDFLENFKEPEPGSSIWLFERGRKHGSARTSRRRGKKGKENAVGEVTSPAGQVPDRKSPSFESADSQGAPRLQLQSDGQPTPQKLMIRLPAASAPPKPVTAVKSTGLRIGNPFAGPEGQALLKGVAGKRKSEAQGGKIPKLIKLETIGPVVKQP